VTVDAGEEFRLALDAPGESGDLVRIAHRERFEQHRIEHGKDGGVGSDAERERQHGDGGNQRSSAHQAQAVAQVSEQAFGVVHRLVHVDGDARGRCGLAGSRKIVNSMRILDVGCGINKKAGAIGIDRNPASKADVLCDLDRFPYPFRDSSFDGLQAVHVIEHVADVIRSMEEFHRLVRAGGEVTIVTPHYTDFSSFCDPTHRWHLNSFSLRFFGEDHGGFGYYSGARFAEISVRVKLLALWRWLGFEWLVNRFPRYRRFWEYYLCYVVRGKVIEWRLKVLK